MHGRNTTYESLSLKRRGYPRVKDKIYPTSADSDIYGDPNDNYFYSISKLIYYSNHLSLYENICPHQQYILTSL
jgi:hypothetical protein